MLTITFENRKPSRAQIMSKVIKEINAGAVHLEIIWGENWIELERYGYQWHGQGWIKELSGDDIAQDLNKFSKA